MTLRESNIRLLRLGIWNKLVCPICLLVRVNHTNVTTFNRCFNTDYRTPNKPPVCLQFDFWYKHLTLLSLSSWMFSYIMRDFSNLNEFIHIILDIFIRTFSFHVKIRLHIFRPDVKSSLTQRLNIKELFVTLLNYHNAYVSPRLFICPKITYLLT